MVPSLGGHDCEGWDGAPSGGGAHSWGSPRESSAAAAHCYTARVGTGGATTVNTELACSHTEQLAGYIMVRS